MCWRSSAALSADIKLHSGNASDDRVAALWFPFQKGRSATSVHRMVRPGH
ncbi:hypothetical protein RBSH_04283 [Rhodopirellula baltica SH28]|uniref:Uncharacterized protein n=1 Tax=Rhodopirellula baltica SH28 TaxID=993517 RepID=K5DC51_RHOBT|nr:hypothetical protein RBSH_04283 [Rhodopirellula baltica SH28]